MQDQRLRQRAVEQMQRRMQETAAKRREVLRRAARKQWLQVAPVHQTVRVLRRRGREDLAAQLLSRAPGIEELGDVTAESDVPGMTALVAEMTRPVPRPEETLELAEVEDLVLEQIIGKSEIMPVRFVHHGSKAARAIGRVVFGVDRPNGTGFLVSPRLVMTNHHVLPNRQEARQNLIQFDFATRADGTQTRPVAFRFRPDELFLTSPVEDLDFTLVAVEPVNVDGARLEDFGWLRLLGDRGKEQQGQRVNIVHHPQGNPKQVSLRENFLVLALDRYLHYMTDTRPGSSGSPVFNDEWEVVALHHAGRSITDPEEIRDYQSALANLGREVSPGAAVLVNEGPRISSIVADLSARAAALDPASGPLLADALDAPVPGSLPAEATTLAPSTGGPTYVTQPGTGAAPVVVTINVGSASAPPAQAASEIELRRQLELYVDEVNSQKSVLRALSFLQGSREGEYLLSETAIGERRQSYYGDLIADVEADSVSPAELYDRLNEIQSVIRIADSFPESIRQLESLRGPGMESGFVTESDAMYARSRAHLYTSVDLREDRMLRCVYTGVPIAPEQLMLKDLLVQLGFMDMLPQRYRNNQYLNCEHIVPQGWFDKEAVPQADMHHLITADGQANNFRSDCAYRQLDGEGTPGPADRPTYLPVAGTRASDPNRFEPARNKGLVARATLYFLVTHKGRIETDKYGAADIATFREWSLAEPPEEHEHHRNEAIFDVQGNRNPLIDFPEWVSKIDFTRGLA